MTQNNESNYLPHNSLTQLEIHELTQDDLAKRVRELRCIFELINGDSNISVETFNVYLGRVISELEMIRNSLNPSKKRKTCIIFA